MQMSLAQLHLKQAHVWWRSPNSWTWMFRNLRCCLLSHRFSRWLCAFGCDTNQRYKILNENSRERSIWNGSYFFPRGTVFMIQTNDALLSYAHTYASFWVPWKLRPTGSHLRPLFYARTRWKCFFFYCFVIIITETRWLWWAIVNGPRAPTNS